MDGADHEAVVGQVGLLVRVGRGGFFVEFDADAGLIARVRAGAFAPDATVLFWHTGGVPGYFAN